jgi:hypothetical protein
LPVEVLPIGLQPLPNVNRTSPTIPARFEPGARAIELERLALPAEFAYQRAIDARKPSGGVADWLKIVVWWVAHRQHSSLPPEYARTLV